MRISDWSSDVCSSDLLGGGISGALIADELAAHGHEVVVIDRRDVGWGSTAASTALLQYEIDTPMTELARRHGEADAVLAYRSCARSEEHTSELQSLMRISYAVFCFKKKKKTREH